MARHQAPPNSDIDLLIEAPEDTSSFDLLGFKSLLGYVLGREVDLISYGILKATFDGGRHPREAVPL